MKEKTIIKNLEKVFSAQIESSRSKDRVQVWLPKKTAEYLLNEGYIEEFFYIIQGVKCKSYILTSLGYLTYCESCQDEEF